MGSYYWKPAAREPGKEKARACGAKGFCMLQHSLMFSHRDQIVQTLRCLRARGIVEVNTGLGELAVSHFLS